MKLLNENVVQQLQRRRQRQEEDRQLEECDASIHRTISYADEDVRQCDAQDVLGRVLISVPETPALFCSGADREPGLSDAGPLERTRHVHASERDARTVVVADLRFLQNLSKLEPFFDCLFFALMYFSLIQTFGECLFS